ncbi:MAG: hypothetical protein QXT20_04530 [Candidatus Woesearchaeota archaeon]
MKTYREWVVLVKENAELVELLSTQIALMNEYVQSEKYQDALNKVNDIQSTISKMKSNAQKREASGVQDFSNNAMASYDAFSQSYNYYKDYINLLIKEDYNNADLKYTEYLKKYSEALSLGSDEESSITRTINEVDTWYQDNIGICFGFFKNYS